MQNEEKSNEEKSNEDIVAKLKILEPLLIELETENADLKASLALAAAKRVQTSEESSPVDFEFKGKIYRWNVKAFFLDGEKYKTTEVLDNQIIERLLDLKSSVISALD